MFSSNDLISFVFANEGDTYYRDDLQKLELEQHLWYLLHENFDAVYFLGEENKQLTVSSFGDHQGPCPDFKKGWFGNAEKQMRNWVQKQLRRTPGRKGTAFVCRLQDFCNVLSQPQWEKTLRDIKQGQDRSGIFVLIASATAEKTTGLLLNSPVFEYLQETAVTNLRSGELREMYDTLAKQKWGSCFFFNAFTLENVRALLMHVIMEHPSRLESVEQLDKLGNTLYNLLNTPGNFSLFAFPFPGKYLTFYHLYKELQRDEIWNRLLEKSCTSICARPETPSVPILREKDSCASHCLQMKLPVGVRGDGSAEMLLQDIRELVSVPKNREENDQILEQENYFQNCIGTISPDDRETYITVLRGLKFCVEQVYMPPKADKLELVLEIVEDYKSVIQASKECYKMKRTLDDSQTESASALTKHNLELTRKNLYIHEKIVAGTNAAILEATQKLNNPSIVEIKEILEKYRETKERNSENTKTAEALSQWEELVEPISEEPEKKKKEPEKKKEKPKKETPGKEKDIFLELDREKSAFDGMSYEEKKKIINKMKPPGEL